MKKAIAITAAAVVGTVAATIALHMIVYAILMTAPQENAARVTDTVKAVCDYARGTIDGESEEACGIALDKSHTEYICTSYEPEAECHVIDKRGQAY